MLQRILWALFLCCLPVLTHAQALPSLIPFTDGSKWGYADSSGTVVIPVQWEEVVFFTDHRAKVLVQKASGTTPRNIYGLIDEQGLYIIAPQAGWIGEWAGSWAKSGLNAIDSNGKYGMIDEAGQVLLPYQWDNAAPMAGPLSDSFKIVYKDGLAGIVNRTGTLVVPCKWAEISPTAELSAIRAFMVRDPDNAGGINSHGIADLGNRLIVPPRYATISLIPLPGGRHAFRAVANANNEPAQTYGNNNDASSEKILDYPTGRQIPAPQKEFTAAPDEEHLPGGYTLSRKGLSDAHHKVLIPCCRFWKVNGDTILLREEKRIGQDSVTLTISWLDTVALRPLKPARTTLLYKQDPPKQEQLYSSYGRSGYGSYGYYQRQETPKILIPDFGAVERFYKDTLLYSIQSLVAPENRHFIVVGYSPGSGQAHYAVIDSNLQYIVPPQTDFRITGYNTADELVIVNGESKRYKTFGYSLLDNKGAELMPPQKGEIMAAFRWQDSLYLFTKVQDECNPNSSGTHIFLTGITGRLLPAFNSLDVAPDLQKRLQPYLHLPAGSVWVTDSAGRTGMLFPDGRPVYPKLYLQYFTVTGTYNGWFLVDNKDNKRRLVDTDNKQILPGMIISSIEPARKDLGYIRSYEDAPFPLPRLYKVTAQDVQGRYLRFYLDDKGRAYLKSILP